MSKEIVNPEGLRHDGRRVGELRNMKLDINPIADADGSCIFSSGNTSVLATVLGPSDKATKQKSPTEAVLEVEYNIAPFSSSDRRNPQSSHPVSGVGGNGNCRELALLIQKIFSNVILLHKWPSAGIRVSITVLCDQGGALAAAINATTGALMVAGIDMKDLIAANTASLYEDRPLVDITLSESRRVNGTCTMACFISSEKIAALHHVQKLHFDKFQMILEAATAGCMIVSKVITDAVREYFTKTIDSS